MQSREGVMYFQIEGQGDKVRYVEIHPAILPMIYAYLNLAEHRSELDGPLFRPVVNNSTGQLDKPLNGRSVLRWIVRKYAAAASITAEVNGPLCAFVTCDGRHQCALASSRYRGSAGVAWPRECFDHAPL